MKKEKENECGDKNCPIHGTLKLRGRTFRGTVINSRMQKTATVEWNYNIYLSKYERFEKRRSRIKVHVPPCVSVKVGDKVMVKECRPISKTKNFVIIKNESN